eukprot:GHVO01004568.1.p1 GENE.GHVO01004568.1~~GHVO01004568.1.p1  ORF type:complete len:159 (-),score=1.64 GHVO01004568.1:207-683(-)
MIYLFFWQWWTMPLVTLRDSEPRCYDLFARIPETGFFIGISLALHGASAGNLVKKLGKAVSLKSVFSASDDETLVTSALHPPSGTVGTSGSQDYRKGNIHSRLHLDRLTSVIWAGVTATVIVIVVVGTIIAVRYFTSEAMHKILSQKYYKSCHEVVNK